MDLSKLSFPTKMELPYDVWENIMYFMDVANYRDIKNTNKFLYDLVSGMEIKCVVINKTCNEFISLHGMKCHINLVIKYMKCCGRWLESDNITIGGEIDRLMNCVEI